MRLASAIVLLTGLATACGGPTPRPRDRPRAAPVITESAVYTDLCKPCHAKGQVCELLVGSGPEGGTPATSASCRLLPASCGGEHDCACFANLKGCRCDHTPNGFVTECPAP